MYKNPPSNYTCYCSYYNLTAKKLYWLIWISLMSEVKEEHEIEKPTKLLPAKVVYKFRYGTKAPKDEYHYDFQFDAEPTEFDHIALREEQPEPHETFKYPEEYTLFLIKPGAMLYKDQITKRIYEEGFITLKEKTVWLSSEHTSEFYNEHYGKPWFPKFIMKMVAGPIHIMVLSKDNAIEDLKALMGNKRVSIARKETPYSLRALYGLKGDSATNAVHGSENVEAAAREIRFFYPQVLIEPFPPVPKCLDYVQESVSEILQKGLIALSRAKPVNPLKWLAEWFLFNNPDSPSIIPNFIMYQP